MFFNVNDYVYVRLTTTGRNILKEKNITAEEDEDGWSKWQLWTLMNTFGENVFNGCSLPFETKIRLSSVIEN